MKVSIILPVVDKYKEFAKEAEASIDAQTIPVEKIIIDANGKNVAEASNEGARKATGKYIMRLDCDDKLHPNTAEFMSLYLDKQPEGKVAVYSDYFLMDEMGNVGERIHQDSPPHPGCMMIRMSAFNTISGFNEDLKRQEGADFYYRLGAIGDIHHIDLPLWFYRRHGEQMSNAHNEVIKARHDVKDTHDHSSEKILAIIPARGGSKGIPRKNLVILDGLPLVVHAIRMAKSSKHDLYVVVSSEDYEIREVATSEGVLAIERPDKDAQDEVNLITVAKHTMEQMDKSFKADIIVTIQPTAPFTPVEALDEALDRLMEYTHLDSTISMSEHLGRHPYRLYKESDLTKHGFHPYFPKECEDFPQRQDRPKAYQFSGGFYCRKRKVLEEWDGDGFALGVWDGIVVTQKEGIDIDTHLDLLLARALLQHGDEL